MIFLFQISPSGIPPLSLSWWWERVGKGRVSAFLGFAEWGTMRSGLQTFPSVFPLQSFILQWLIRGDISSRRRPCWASCVQGDGAKRLHMKIKHITIEWIVPFWRGDQMPIMFLYKVEGINNDMWRFCDNPAKESGKTQNMEKKSLMAVFSKSGFSEFEMFHSL